MAKVKCPNQVTEKMYGLLFVDGVSEEFDNKELLNRLVARGYKVVESIDKKEPENEVKENDELKKILSFNKTDITAYAIENGVEVLEEDTKAQIAEKLKEALGLE